MALPRASTGLQTALDIPGLLQAVADRPYSPLCRMKLSAGYSRLEYHDLASGEAYMTILLCDEIYDDDAEYHEYTVDAASEDMNANNIPDLAYVHTLPLENDGARLNGWVKLKIEHWA
jgi:hypothetical protein